MLYRLLWWFGVISAYPVQLLFYKPKKYYAENADKHIKGGGLIISNHFSFYDYPLVMFAVLPRKLGVVCSEIPYKSKLLTIGMKFFDGIQANRITKDLSFIDKSAEFIKKGNIIQIFPEGRNTDDGTIKPFKHSYILIAHRSNSPIIPVVVDGNYGFKKRARMIIGEKIFVSDIIDSKLHTPTRDDMKLVNDYVYNRVLELRQQLEDIKEREKSVK